MLEKNEFKNTTKLQTNWSKAFFKDIIQRKKKSYQEIMQNYENIV